MNTEQVNWTEITQPLCFVLFSSWQSDHSSDAAIELIKIRAADGSHCVWFSCLIHRKITRIADCNQLSLVFTMTTSVNICAPNSKAHTYTQKRGRERETVSGCSNYWLIKWHTQRNKRSQTHRRAEVQSRSWCTLQLWLVVQIRDTGANATTPKIRIFPFVHINLYPILILIFEPISNSDDFFHLILPLVPFLLV